MLERIIVIGLIVLALVGLVYFLYRQLCHSTPDQCKDCALRSICKRALTLWMLFLPGVVWAHLQGAVLDDTGEPLAGANIYWAGTTIGTTTDEQGTFEIEPIRQTKQLVTSYLGYRNDTTLVTNHDFIKVVLVPDGVLDEVVVMQRKMDVLRSRFSAFDIETIGSGELCRLACCNLSEAFETNASVDVSYSDAATGMKQIKMLGLNGTYIQLLNENCPAAHGLGQSFGMEYIPGTWIQSVQISKGTSSVLNGYEAIAGQINVEYLKPQTQDPIEVDVLLNTDLAAAVDVTGGWDIPVPKDPMLGVLSTGLLAHYQNSLLETDDNKDGFLDMPTYHTLNLLNRWYYKNDNYSLQLLVRGTYDERHGGQRKVHIPSPYLLDLRTGRIDGFMKHGVLLDEETGMSLGIVAAASYHDQYNQYGNRLWKASQVNGYLNVIFQNTWEGGPILGGDTDNDHQLSAGISLNYDQYKEDLTLLSKFNMNRTEVTPGLFAEYTYKIEDMFSMVAGLRADWSSRYGIFCTPRLNVRYSPWEWWTIRASVGIGYRSPNIIADNAQYLPSNREWTYLGKNLSDADWGQERSMNTGATMTFDIPIRNRTLQVTAEYYYTRFTDAVIVDLDRDRHTVSFYNLCDVPGAQSFSHSAQLEASMEILSGWTMTAAFRYTDVRQTTYNAAAKMYQLREKALQSRFKGVITTGYKTPNNSWQFDVTAQFNGPGRLYDGLDSRYYSWYPQLMAQITKNFRHNVTVYVGAENMTNYTQNHPVLGDCTPEGIIDTSSPDFDASTVWAPLTGWQIYCGLRWNLDRPNKTE
ncbi:MAG: TonB-dependent receptor [Paludibacteraceae bacterium]|nr:TonB-dependent receptor [Paludibacteraceae bacterium]